MIESFKKYVNQFIQLKEDEFRAFENILESRQIRKKEHFVSVNEICNKVLFFREGYFRFYHTGTSGNEITSDFYFAPGFVTSYTSFIIGNPSFVNVQALEDMEVFQFRKNDLYSLYSNYPRFERLGRLIAESIVISSEKHLFLLLNQTAEIRYKNLLGKYPQFIKQIPLQYIASYLGITQETLSRMRKSLR
jgi:CRP-like cAMP-binding protein